MPLLLTERAVSMIKLRGNFILKEDVHNHFKQRLSASKFNPDSVSADDFVVMFANLSGRRWEPTWDEKRRLALEQLEEIAARVEIDAKQKMFKG
jgi:hypothetical protein